MHPGSQGPRRGNDPAARAGETTDQINHGTFGPINYPGYPATVRPGRQYADFVVIKNSGTYSTRWLRGDAERTLGPPRQTYVVGPYTIMTWHANLLTRLGGHRG